MNRTAWLQERRMAKFEDVLERWNHKELSCAEAGELLGCSERQFRRYCGRYREEGPAGLVDRRLGRAAARRVPADRIAWVLDEYRTTYPGWNVKHFQEELQARHGFELGYTWLKLRLHDAGLVHPGKRRGAHRRKRPRKPCAGMMLHQDGSRHAWLQGADDLDLIVTLDDATSEIYSAFLVAEEGTASSLRALLETFAARGLPCSLYTDRGSHYFHTPRAGGKVDRAHLTQVGRALDRLGVEHIAAYSPPGARPVGANVRHLAGSLAQGAEARRDHRCRGGQPLHRRAVSSGTQRPLRQAPRDRRQRLRGGRARAAGRASLHRR